MHPLAGRVEEPDERRDCNVADAARLGHERDAHARAVIHRHVEHRHHAHQRDPVRRRVHQAEHYLSIGICSGATGNDWSTPPGSIRFVPVRLPSIVTCM